MYPHIENSVLILTGYSPAKKAAPAKKAVTPQEAEVPKKVTAIASNKKGLAPKKATTDAKSAVDDLTKIEGIGPKIAGLLKADGIETFEKLSESKLTAIQTILDKAGNRYAVHNPSTWAEQAKLAAKSDWAGLKKWQNELNGGKA